MAQRLEWHQPKQTNLSSQRRMAEILLTEGLDEAIELAVFNGWQGVLNELYAIAPAHRTREAGSQNAKKT